MITDSEANYERERCDVRNCPNNSQEVNIKAHIFIVSWSTVVTFIQARGEQLLIIVMPG